VQHVSPIRRIRWPRQHEETAVVQGCEVPDASIRPELELELTGYCSRWAFSWSEKIPRLHAQNCGLVVNRWRSKTEEQAIPDHGHAFNAHPCSAVFTERVRQRTVSDDVGEAPAALDVLRFESLARGLRPRQHECGGFEFTLLPCAGMGTDDEHLIPCNRNGFTIELLEIVLFVTNDLWHCSDDLVRLLLGLRQQLDFLASWQKPLTVERGPFRKPLFVIHSKARANALQGRQAGKAADATRCSCLGFDHRERACDVDRLARGDRKCLRMGRRDKCCQH